MDDEQCHGLTQKGTRCRALGVYFDANDRDNGKRYCERHTPPETITFEEFIERQAGRLNVIADGIDRVPIEDRRVGDYCRQRYEAAVGRLADALPRDDGADDRQVMRRGVRSVGSNAPLWDQLGGHTP